MRDNLPGNPWRIFGHLSENFKINRKPWENYFGQILWKISRKCHLINYLLTGFLVPYPEILSPQILRTDLASSARTSKLRA